MSRILLVEDSLDILEALQCHLEADGYEVFVATRAAQGLALAASVRPSLMLVDIELPDRDGFHVVQALRERGNDCPVLILSARTLEADKLQGFRLGADDYVTKPFSIMELLARIAALIRRSSHAAAPKGEKSAPNGPSDDALCERYGLTPRQVEAARLAADGCSNAEIAERMQISYYTARNHIEQIILKLAVPNRAAIGALLYGGPS